MKTGEGSIRAVTFGKAGDAAGIPFTVADLERTPDDGRRYEVLDGTLIASPRLATGHQRVGFSVSRDDSVGQPDKRATPLARLAD